MPKIGLFALLLLFTQLIQGQNTVLNKAQLDEIEIRLLTNPDSCLIALQAAKPQQPELQAFYLFLEGNCYLYTNKTDSAAHFFSKSETLASGDHKLLAGINYGKGYIMYLKNDLNAAKKYYIEADLLSKNVNDNNLKSIIFTELGSVYLEQNLSDSSLYYYKMALIYCRALKNKAKIASAFNNISIAYYKTGDYEKAIEWQINAIKTKEQLGDTLSLATSLNNVGSFFIKLKKFNDAKRYLSRSIRLLKNESKIAGFSALNLGVCFKMMGQYDSAIYYDNKALGIYKKLKLEGSIGKVYSNLGGVYEAMNDFQQAIGFMQKALEISKNLKNKYEIALRSRNIANVYLLMNKPKLASTYIFEAHKLADELGSVELTMEVDNIMSKYYEQTGKYALALHYFKQYKTLTDSLYNENSQKMISELTTKYETEKKEKEILNLKNQRRIKNLELAQKENTLTRQRLILFFTILTILLVLLTLFLGFKRYKLKQDNAKTLMARQKTELEQRMLLSQMNPHFIFNSLASVQEFIGINEPAKAQEFLSGFARLMRSILENSRRQFIPLDEEINSLVLYIDLEKQRFNNKFIYTLNNLVEEPEFLMIPPMLVQPFVENAIVHGFANKKSDGRLLVEYSQIENLIQIIIEDNGDGRANRNKPETGTGKQHVSLGSKVVAERIELLNNELKCNASVIYHDLQSNDGHAGGTRVILNLPFKNRED